MTAWSSALGQILCFSSLSSFSPRLRIYAHCYTGPFVWRRRLSDPALVSCLFCWRSSSAVSRWPICFMAQLTLDLFGCLVLGITPNPSVGVHFPRRRAVTSPLLCIAPYSGAVGVNPHWCRIVVSGLLLVFHPMWHHPLRRVPQHHVVAGICLVVMPLFCCMVLSFRVSIGFVW